MMPVNAKVSRKGITFKDLIFDEPDDPALKDERFTAGSRLKPFSARMDMRDIGHLYYLRDGSLHTARLNPNKTSNEGLNGMTMAEYNAFRKIKKAMDQLGELHNLAIDAALFDADSITVANAAKKTFSNTKDIREKRAKDKMEGQYGNRVAKRLPEGEQPANSSDDTVKEQNPDNDSTDGRAGFSSFEEAFSEMSGMF